MIADLIRLGVVSAVDAAKCAVRVVIEDRDNLVSGWLPVILSQTVGNRDYSLPQLGERVLCLFLANGLETGFCLGSIYVGGITPPTSSGTKRGIWFADGSRVEFDTATGTLTVDAKGAVNIKTANSVKIDGDLDVTGSITKGGVSL